MGLVYVGAPVAFHVAGTRSETVRIAAITLISAVVAACGAPAPAAPMPRTPDEPMAGSDPAAAPENDRDRADAVLSELRAFCAGHDDSCGAAARPDIYPNAEVSEVDRRFVDDRREQLRTLGVTVRWDPGTRRFEIVRGTTPVFGGELRDDP